MLDINVNCDGIFKGCIGRSRKQTQQIVCEICGANVNYNNIKRHLKSKKCMAAVNSS